MSIDRGNNQGPQWPAYRVLFVCAVLAAAGYGAALLRGNPPAGAVKVVIIPPPEAEAPPQP